MSKKAYVVVREGRNGLRFAADVQGALGGYPLQMCMSAAFVKQIQFADHLTESFAITLACQLAMKEREQHAEFYVRARSEALRLYAFTNKL